MASPLVKRFIPRAARYTLDSSDDKVMRFARNGSTSESFSTEFINVSSSGLAFLIDRDFAPNFGDIIKVEFPIPGNEKVAWWARVVRVAEYSPYKWWMKNIDNDDRVSIAVTFQNLPEQHMISIHESLRKKFHEIRRKKRLEEFKQLKSFINQHKWNFLLYCVCTIFTFSILFMLTRPTADYTAERGSPWGQRFK